MTTPIGSKTNSNPRNFNTPDLTEKTFKEIDQNGDGKITYGSRDPAKYARDNEVRGFVYKKLKEFLGDGKSTLLDRENLSVFLKKYNLEFIGGFDDINKPDYSGELDDVITADELDSALSSHIAQLDAFTMDGSEEKTSIENNTSLNNGTMCASYSPKFTDGALTLDEFKKIKDLSDKDREIYGYEEELRLLDKIDPKKESGFHKYIEEQKNEISKKP